MFKKGNCKGTCQIFKTLFISILKILIFIYFCVKIFNIVTLFSYIYESEHQQISNEVNLITHDFCSKKCEI